MYWNSDWTGETGWFKLAGVWLKWRPKFKMPVRKSSEDTKQVVGTWIQNSVDRQTEQYVLDQSLKSYTNWTTF